MTLTILILSTLLQFSAAVLALRLIKETGHRIAWACLAVALTLMGIRRSITIFRVINDNQALPADPTAEFVALIISAMMLTGVILVGRLFRDDKFTQTKLSNNEKRFRNFAEASSDWLWEMDVNLTFSYFSKKFTQTTGMDPTNLLGRKLQHTVLLGNDQTQTARTVLALEKRKPFRDHVVGLTKSDGTVAYFRVNGVPYHDDFGTFKGFRGTGTDVTEETLQRHRLQAIFDHAPVEIYLKDVEGRYLQINREFERLFNVKNSDMVGKFPESAHTDRLAKTTRDHDLAVLNSGLPVTREETADTEKGIRYLHTIKFPVRDETGRISGLGAVVSDVTELRNAQMALSEALTKAEQANHAKSEFLAAISHELRTPLNAIIGFSEILQQEIFGKHSNERYQEYSKDIYDAGLHLISIINNVLDISKIEAGEAVINPELFEISEVIKDVISLISLKSDSFSNRITVKLDDGVKKLYADRRMVKQVLLNLLSNANKFTPEDGRISVSGEFTRSGDICLKVTDTGKGMTEEEIKIALEPFGQIRPNAHVAHEGTGLGLPIAQRMMELHGGTLDVESEPQKGTTITIIFPGNAKGS